MPKRGKRTMLDANGLPAEDAAPEEEAKAEPVDVLAGNCGGELEELPQVEGVTFTQYKCKECGQLVHVGHEEREANGLPTQHHKLEEDK
jgi:hypothetical protein